MDAKAVKLFAECNRKTNEEMNRLIAQPTPAQWEQRWGGFESTVRAETVDRLADQRKGGHVGRNTGSRGRGNEGGLAGKWPANFRRSRGWQRAQHWQG